MTNEGTFFLIIGMLFVSGISMAALGLYGRKFIDRVPAATPYVILMFCAAAWAVLYALDLLTINLPVRVFYHNLRFLFLPFFSILEIWLVIAYVNRIEWIRWDWAAAALIVPVLTSILAMTSPYHTFFRYNFFINTSGPIPVLQYSESPFFLFYNVYSVALLLLAILILVVETRRKGILREMQTSLLLLALAIPTLLNSLFQSGVSLLPGINMAPVFLFVPAILYTIALFRYRFLDVIPVARSRVIDTISSPILVLDTVGRVIDLNPAACSLISHSPSSAIGKPFESLVPDWPDLMALVRNSGTRQQDHILSREDRNRHYALTTEPLLSPNGVAEGQILILQDITGRKAAEEALRESEDRFRRLLSRSFDAVVVHQDGKIVVANDAAAQLIGSASYQEVLGKTLLDFVHPDYRQLVMERIRRMLESPGATVPLIEEKFVRLDGSVFTVEVMATQIQHEGKPAVMVVFRDISSQKQAEEEIFRSRQMLQLVLDTIPQRVFWKDRNSVFLGCNKPLAEDAGYADPAGLIGKDDYATASRQTADQYRADDRFVMETGLPKLNYEEMQIKPDGSEAWLLTSKIPLRNRTGEIIGVLGTYEDITARKRDEKELRESREMFRTFLDHTYDAVFIHDPEGKVIDVNATMLRMYGISREEALQCSIADFTGPANQMQEAEEHWRKALAGEDQFFTWQARRPKDNSVFDVEVYLTRLVHRGRDIILASVRDITERKRVEQQIADRSRFLSTLIDTLPIPLFYKDQDGRYLGCNPPFEEYVGVSRDVLVGKTVYDVAPKDLADLSLAADQELFVSLKLQKYESLVQFADGTQHDVIFYKTPFFTADGSVGGLIGTFLDITERKAIEEALRENEARLGSILHGSPILQFVIDRSHRVISWNKAIEEYSGIRATEIIGTDHQWQAFYPDKRPILADLIIDGNAEGITRLYAGKIRKSRYVEEAYEAVDFFPSMGTSGVWLAFTAAPIRDAQGEIIGAIETLEDITERRKAEDALLAEKQFSDVIIDSIPGIFYVLDERGFYIRGNRNQQIVVGYTAEELHGMNALETIAEEDRDLVAGKIREVFTHDFTSITVNVLTKDRRKIPYILTGIPVTIAGKKFIVGTGIDLTERVRAEEALRESEKNYRAIIENMQDFVYQADMDGNFTMVSPSGVRLLGFDSMEQMIGMPVKDVYANPDDRGKFLAALREKGSVYGYPLVLRSRDDRLLHVVASSHFLHDSQGIVQGVEGILHDVTELRQVEEALRAANKKLNLLSSITRHDIRNQLMGLKGYQELSGMALGDPVKLAEYLEREKKLVDLIERQISFTKDYEDLGVNNPTWQKVKDCVNNAGSSLPMRSIRIEEMTSGLEVFADPLLDKVFYNLFENALRYGGEAMTTIRVSCHEASSGSLVLVIEDNGAGIVPEDKAQLFDKGFGKNTGLGLFLSREILSITGITIIETGMYGRGARFEVTVPKGKYRYPYRQ